MKQKKDVEQTTKNRKAQTNEKEVKIKYDILTPEDREPQPKDYDEIEY